MAMTKERNKTVQDIIKDYLKTNGFGGLFNADGECACELLDLFPCEAPGEKCEAGYKSECNPDTCNFGGYCGFHISRRKRRGRQC